jgi:VIT1/CCC1 family predicted Fe2+/Mn2+ transporter
MDNGNLIPLIQFYILKTYLAIFSATIIVCCVALLIFLFATQQFAKCTTLAITAFVKTHFQT